MSTSSAAQPKPSLLPAVVLALSALVAGAGFGIYAPLLAVHALEMGAPEAMATAMILALPSITSLILLLPIGILADKTGRRKEIISVGLVLGILFNALLGFARTWVELAVYRTIAGIVFAFTSLYMAIGALISPPEKRGTILGFLAGSMMLGMGVSQIFAGTIATSLGGYQPVYFLAAGLTVVSLLLLLPVKAPKVQLPAMKIADIAAAWRSRGVYWTAISICVYLIGWNLMYPSLSIVLNVIYGAPPEVFSLAMGVASVMLGIGTYIWGPVVDKMGGRKTLMMAILASAVVTFIMYPALGSMWAYTVLFWIVTVFGVVGMPGTSYVASRSVRPELISVAITAIFFAISIAAIVGGFASGALIATAGLGVTILIAAVLELIGGLMTFGLPKV
ncbi:MAG: MFS transporter [Ignisphaera sp.]|nr:MFS transporter [Ignisphaera sp.]MCX8167526.1 MFS transporter [Ignisphaera sp.]MDW8084611.1 MFS transporter [Ignisphaera sp.]